MRFVGTAGTWTRFWSRVSFASKDDGCWLWEGDIALNGYGRFSFDGGRQYAHRFAYVAMVGPIPVGLQLDHVKALGCEHRNCVNPAHLEPVTLAENIRRGRNLNREKTHCPDGHPYSGDNVRNYGGRAGRQCVTCNKIRSKNWSAS